MVDIASVKAAIQDELRRRGVDLARYVGTHPMAGREKSGPVAARGELFTSMPWVVCPSEETSAAALQAARALATDLGAVVSQFTADEHDEAVALVSHLPQVMSSLLASRLQGTPLHALSLAGQRAAGRHPHRRQRSHAVGPDPWRQCGKGRGDPATASAKTSTG